jgi:hypothetical protein
MGIVLPTNFERRNLSFQPCLAASASFTSHAAQEASLPEEIVGRDLLIFRKTTPRPIHLCEFTETFKPEAKRR